MGQFASSFVPFSGSLVTEVSDPGKKNWITANAQATGLSEHEVLRCWRRFQQLGADEKGQLPNTALDTPPASKNIFVRNVLANLQTEDDVVDFQTFLNAMKWAEYTSVENKVRAVFYLINGGDEIDADLLERVFKRMYPNDSQLAVSTLADHFIERVDGKEQGYLTEEQLVTWMMTLPDDELARVTKFSILPQETKEPDPKVDDPKKAEKMQKKRETTAKKVVSDSVLKQVAEKVQRKDWPLLANQLSITSDELTQFEEKYPRELLKQVLEMLKAWKKREAKQALTEVLEEALNASFMAEIVPVLYA